MPPAAFSLRSEAQRTEAYAFASSLAAVLLDSLFEHPARDSRQSCSAILLVDKRRDLDRFLNQAIARKRL